MKRLLALPLALAAAASFAAPKSASQAVDVTLQAGDVHEVCARLARGDKRRYHWTSSVPVDFNVHYHEGKQAFYPVKRDATRGGDGTFTAKIAQDYCWMWTARAAPAKITGEVAE